MNAQIIKLHNDGTQYTLQLMEMNDSKKHLTHCDRCVVFKITCN